VAWSAEPVAVQTTARFESLSAHYAGWMGDHNGSSTCGVTRPGKVWCWGEALPDGVKAIRYTPADVSPAAPMRQLADGGYVYRGGYVQAVYYCGLDQQRALWCASGRGPYTSGAAVPWQQQAGISAETLLQPGGLPCWLTATRQPACARVGSGCSTADYCSADNSRIVSGTDTLTRMPRQRAAALGASGMLGVDSLGRLFAWDDHLERPQLILLR
jgi:hypothetical protein